jgi:ABC-type oligopeptide transport system substrate-binding subunit
MKAMHDAEKIAMEDMGVLPIYFKTAVIAQNPKLKDVLDPGNTIFNFKYAHFE